MEEEREKGGGRRVEGDGERERERESERERERESERDGTSIVEAAEWNGPVTTLLSFDRRLIEREKD